MQTIAVRTIAEPMMVLLTEFARRESNGEYDGLEYRAATFILEGVLVWVGELCEISKDQLLYSIIHG